MNTAAEHCLLVSRDRAGGRLLAEVAHIPGELESAIAQLFDNGQSVRLHELKIGDGIYDCTLQSTQGEGVLLEFQNLEWEQMRIRLLQREVQTGMLSLMSRNLGHEVRNPLGGIRGAAELMTSGRILLLCHGDI